MKSVGLLLVLVLISQTYAFTAYFNCFKLLCSAGVSKSIDPVELQGTAEDLFADPSLHEGYDKPNSGSLVFVKDTGGNKLILLLQGGKTGMKAKLTIGSNDLTNVSLSQKVAESSTYDSSKAQGVITFHDTTNKTQGIVLASFPVGLTESYSMNLTLSEIQSISEINVFGDSYSQDIEFDLRKPITFTLKRGLLCSSSIPQPRHPYFITFLVVPLTLLGLYYFYKKCIKSTGYAVLDDTPSPTDDAYLSREDDSFRYTKQPDNEAPTSLPHRSSASESVRDRTHFFEKLDETGAAAPVYPRDREQSESKWGDVHANDYIWARDGGGTSPVKVDWGTSGSPQDASPLRAKAQSEN